jgi:hypothetical protein
MSTMESRKREPRRRLTFSDLLAAAQSSDPNQRKHAYMAYRSWWEANARIPPNDRLTWMQRHVLTKIFTDKGFIKAGSTDARTRAK